MSQHTEAGLKMKLRFMELGYPTTIEGVKVVRIYQEGWSVDSAGCDDLYNAVKKVKKQIEENQNASEDRCL